MLLSDADIRSELEAGTLRISPWEPALLQPGSVDLRLDRYFLALRAGKRPIDPAADSAHLFEAIEVCDGDRLRVDPRECVLASTYEQLTIPDDITAQVHGKSSIGRLFLLVHTAGLIDAGFVGTVTLELVNLADRPMYLYPGMRIAQVAFERMSSPASRPYGSAGLASRYQSQPQGPVPSRSWHGFNHGLPSQTPLAS